MKETLDSIHQAFLAHRQKQPRGPYPSALRRRALTTLTQRELGELANRLQLTLYQLGRWGPLLGAAAPTEAQFYEIERPFAGAAGQKSAAFGPAAIELEIDWPGGPKARVHGRLDEAMLQTLFAALQAAQRAP